MIGDIQDLEYLKKFNDELRQALNGPNIRHVSLRELKGPARKSGTKTRFGSWGWRCMISSRIAQKTVYLGSHDVQLPNPDAIQTALVKNAPKELQNVLHWIKSLPFVHLRMQMCDNDDFNPICNYYVSVADLKNYRLPFMWGHTMGKPRKKTGPEFVMLQIPEEHMMRQQVLTIPEHNLNIALGTDYMGEAKKGFLRQGMWCADERGMLGLHAGTKVVTVRDARDGKLKKYGVFIFGLTATGKSTWSCHQLGMDPDDGEKTEVAQDDIVFLRRDGSAYGTEQGFFVKTDVRKDLQEAMYYALIDKTALYENVHIDAAGTPDFLDETLCGNGRAVIQKNRLRIRRGRRFVGISAKSINLPPLAETDGLVFAFITRRHTILPFAQELTPEQAALAYLWGESQHSMATKPEKAGESVRIVGTDDFIIGSRARKVNRFYDILMDLVDNFPGKVRCYQYNTGGVGEILESFMEGGKKKKRMVRKVDRVPLDIMSGIQRGDLRGMNEYAIGRFGTREIVAVEGKPLKEFEPSKFYNQGQIDEFVRELVKGRREFTEEVAIEGLKPEILDAAERSFSFALNAIGRKGSPGKGASADAKKFSIPADTGRERSPGGFRNF